MKNKLLLIVLSIALILSFSCTREGSEKSSQSSTIHIIDSVQGLPNPAITLRINSKILNEDRNIYVQLPEGYSHGSSEYPLLIVLDGEWLFHLAYTHQRFYSYDEVTDQCLPRMIVVGIENTDRDRNYVPTKNSGIEHVFETAGEADTFLTFLEKELIPMLEQRYRVANHRCLMGWSFSGLFTTYTAITKPDLFNFHLCISPAIWWDNDLTYNYLEDIELGRYKRMVFTLGSGEKGGYVYTSTIRFLEKLHQDYISNLDYDLIEIDGVGHSWGVSTAINKGLQALYQEYIPPSDIIFGDLPGLIKYYAQLSEKWGWEISPPNPVLNVMAENLEGNDQLDKAIEVLNYAIKHDPGNSWTYYQYARIHKSREEFEKARLKLQEAIDAEMKKSVPDGLNVIYFKKAMAKLETETTK